ncbi:MAG: TIGR02186 family protein [Rickettsiales bacterium]
MYKIFFLFFIYLNLALNSNAKPLDSDLSQNQILIDARFQGQKIFLFGARNLVGEILVIVRGPKKNFIVRKKEKFAGIWLNKKQMKFYDINSFYDFYASFPLNNINNEILLQNLNIGIENLTFNYKGEAYLEELLDFKNAIIAERNNQELYSNSPKQISFMGDTLFKTNLIFPKKIPYGIYNIEIYLINENKISGIQTIPLEVKKTGFEALIYNLAHEHSLLYGIICVLAAIIAGWFASLIFWKV